MTIFVNAYQIGDSDFFFGFQILSGKPPKFGIILVSVYFTDTSRVSGYMTDLKFHQKTG